MRFQEWLKVAIVKLDEAEENKNVEEFNRLLRLVAEEVSVASFDLREAIGMLESPSTNEVHSMSELTKCNFCTLRWIREDAARRGKEVTVQGQRVFVHDKGEALRTWTQKDRGEVETSNQVAWLMVLTDHCVC